MDLDPLQQLGSVGGIPSGLLKAAMKVMRGVDITEVFSPERVAAEAKRFGLSAGLSMDLTTGWDFTVKEHRRRAKQYIWKNKPLLVIGSPVCTPFSRLQALNWGRSWKTDMKLQRDLEEATRHMEFVAELYKMQDKAGIYYLHENFAQATSWQLACIQRVMGMASTQLVEADQCRYGLMSRDPKYGWGPARKPTKFMTNSVMVARELNLRCEGDHDHVHLMSGRAGPAARYLRGLCEVICR